MRSVGEHFSRNVHTVIPCTLCEHLRVSPPNISFRHSRNFSSKSPKYSADRCGSFCTQNSLVLLSEFSAMPSMIPCTLCVHLMVSSEYPAYAVYSHILCRQEPAAPVSFCFLWRHLCRYTSLSFFFGKKKRKKATNKKESLKFNQNIRLNQKIKICN